MRTSTTPLSMSLMFLIGCQLSFLTMEAQPLNKNMRAEFRAAPDLSVTDFANNTRQLTTSSGEVISFVDLVRKNWPEKNVVLIDRKEYDKMKGVGKVFYISLLSFRLMQDGSEHSSMDGIGVKRGKLDGV